MSATTTLAPVHPTEALTAAELEELDALLAHFEDTPSLEELDGLFCALITGPVEVPQEEWLAAVVGEAPEWASEAQAQRTIELLLKHWHAVADGFREDWSGITPEVGAEIMFFPLMDDPVESGHPLGEGWARGFRAGLDWLEEPHWDALEEDEECVAVLGLIATLDSGEDNRGKPITEDDRDSIISPMSAGLQYLYTFWRRWLRVINAPREPHRAEDVPGRNDPCSCGSGKKFKKCCGAPERLH